MISDMTMLPALLWLFSIAVLALVRIVNGQRTAREICRSTRFERLLGSLCLAFLFGARAFTGNLWSSNLGMLLFASIFLAFGVRNFVKEKNQPRPPDFPENTSN